MTAVPDNARLLRQVIDIEMLAYLGGCQVKEAAFGQIVTHEGYSLLYDANLVLLKRFPSELEISQLEEAVRPSFQAVEAHHLRFILVEPGLSTELLPRFLAAGYRHSRFLFMVHRHEATRLPVPEIKIHEVKDAVGHSRLDQIEAELLRETTWNSPIIRNILRTRRRELVKCLNLRWFWAEMRSTAAGSIGLLTHGGLASIQGVSTRPTFRGRSVATTMVLRMLQLAQEQGSHTVCLMTEENDWPHQLYAKLGFDVIGHIDSVVKDE